jgi:hypothetical protein
VDLIVATDGREIGRWRVHQAAYGKLLNLLQQQRLGPYAIPHAADMQYEGFVRLPGIKVHFDQQVERLLGLIVRLFKGQYALDDTPGIRYAEALAWWQAAETLYQSMPLGRWRHMQWSSGPPSYGYHCAQLTDELPQLQAANDALDSFLLSHPVPEVTLAPERKALLTSGDGSRYPHRLQVEHAL